LILCLSIILTGCSGKKNSVELIRDYPTTEIKTALNLDNTLNGDSLKADIDRNIEYYDVKIASEANESLFYNSINIEEYTDHRLQKFRINLLYFNTKLLSGTTQNFVNEMNNKDYGIAKKLSKSFSIVENRSVSLVENLSITKDVLLPNDFTEKENDDRNLIVVYLPTYCVHFDGKQDVARVYLMIPVYYAFAYSSEVSSYTEGIKEYKVNLTDGVLPQAE
ncbi:MAG: hypothetical protein K2I42_03830, partial [Anaeroplasmataceae bacterium]|nr:hypothetical protein [Anaeroplasmataceae bacterium]